MYQCLQNFITTKRIFTSGGYLSGNSPAKFFSVFRYERNVPVECTGTNARYLSHDTTTFIFTMPVDKEFSSSLHSFFIVPFDQYENPGGSSSIVIMDKGSLDRTFYKKAMAGKLSDRLGIKVSWKMSNPECIRRMEIYRSDAVDGKYELLATVGGSDTTFVDPNVIPDKNYFYHLKAIGTYPFQKKESHYFSAVAMDTRPPVTPAILSAIQVPNGVELKVRVNDAYIYGMRVYRNDGTGDELQPISDLVGAKDSTITYRDTSKVLNGYRNYVYKVRTESFSHVLSDYSNEAFVRPGIRTIPSPPGNFHGWIADGRARLFWDDGENQPDVILGYKVTRTEVNPQTGKAAGKEISITGNSLLRSNFYTDSAMVHGKTYTYAVYTIDRNHNASSSFATITLVLPEELPVPPAGLKAQTTDQGVVLKWGMAEFEKLSFYRIYRYQRGKDPEILKLAGKNETTYTDHSAIPGELYFYYLTSIDKADKESEPCDEVGITR